MSSDDSMPGARRPRTTLSGLRRRRAEELFQQAADLAPYERGPLLDRLCSGDSELRAETEALLACLEDGQVSSLQKVEEREEAQGKLIGQHVGPYRILELIGEGGFGAVYMAEQETPIRRRVALKVIKLGMDTKQVVARFEAERQALAMMDHSNIARVFEAGATESGRPFFAMELVRGVPITEYSDEHCLSIRERLELFTLVCRAVQHAHQKGIIHRDIKPSNVLVTLRDGVPVPKIIDFGIAKATQARLTDRTLFTSYRQFIGTPEYMSPEQAEMSELGVDTRSDIYSLGVLLYELITGTTPCDSKALRTATYAEVQRMICQQEPPVPSRRLSAMKSKLEAVAKARKVEPRRLGLLVQGDLDWIVMKTLEKDRTRRYESAGELAADVQRHLDNEPVTARSPSALYQLRKLVARHKVPFGFLAAVVFLLAGFGVWMSFLYAEADWLRMEAEASRHVAETNLDRARESENRAQAEAQRAKWVVDFLVGLFKTPDPVVAQGTTVTVREVLDRGAVRIREELKDEPDVQTTLMETIGHVYANLGFYKESAPLLRSALQIRRAQLGEEHKDTLSTLHELGRTLMYDGESAEAQEVLREAVAVGRRTLGDRDPATLGFISSLAWLLQSTERYVEAEQLYREVVEGQRDVLGPDDPETIESLAALSWVLLRLGKLNEAEPLAREALEGSRRVHGDEGIYTTNAMSILGMLLVQQRKPDEAAPLLRNSEIIHRRVLGDEHPATLQCMADVATVLREQDRLDEAEEQCRRLVAACRRALGDEHEQTIRARLQLGGVLLHKGDFADADAILSLVLADLRRKHGEYSHYTLMCKYRLGHVRVALDRLEEGEALLRAALDGFISTEGPGLMRTFGGFLHWSAAFLSSDDWAVGEPFLRKVVAYLRREFGEEDAATRLATMLLSLAKQDPPCGAATEALLHDYLAHLQNEMDAGETQATVARGCLGRCLAAQGRFEEAEPLLLESFRVLSVQRGESDGLARAALRRIIRLYTEWERPQQAEEWKVKLDETSPEENRSLEAPPLDSDFSPVIVTELLPLK